MSNRPPNEPTKDFDPQQRLWDDADRHTLSLGCPTCPDFARCGGLHNEARILDCAELCSCADKTKCDMVCRFNPRGYVQRVREVYGLELESAPRVPILPVPDLPVVIPWVNHKYSRAGCLNEPVIALSLYDIVNMAKGKPHVTTREQLAKRFRIPATSTIVLTGVERDPVIERWWELPNREEILSAIRALGVALVTTPNYSVLTNVPRPDNFHSMKRTLIAWTEIVAAGIPGALHINARTERDYENWAIFINCRPEIQAIAFEFGTGCGFGDRIDWHVDQLRRLSKKLDRPITFVVRGGTQKLTELRAIFPNLVLIDTDPFARSMRRRRAYITEAGRLKWAKVVTPKGFPLDDLFAHNVKVCMTARVQTTTFPKFSRTRLPKAR